MHARGSGSTLSCGTLARNTDEEADQVRGRVAGTDQVLGLGLQHLRAHVAAVLDHHGEAAGPAHAADGRRPKTADLRLLNLGELLLASCAAIASAECAVVAALRIIVRG